MRSRRRVTHSPTTRKRAAEAAGLELPPQLRAVTASRLPRFVKQRQVQLERVLPGAENVRTLTADDLAYELAAMARAYGVITLLPVELILQVGLASQA